MVAPETLRQTGIMAVQEGLAEVIATQEVLDQMAVLVVQEVPGWTEEDLAVDQEEVAAEEVYHGEEDKV